MDILNLRGKFHPRMIPCNKFVYYFFFFVDNLSWNEFSKTNARLKGHF